MICCEEYEDGMEEINGFIITASVRAGNNALYKSPPFQYCPWCGTKLKNGEENECRDI